MSYPDLATQYGWPEGIHRAPAGYQHPWLVVTASGTVGCWSRREAREVWRAYRESGVLSA